ncbi:MAG: hypothetical protein II832_00250, partial [Synergistaceae bacterium]|nr:hypothetical protein [Synergistaceae bacterium]
FLVFWPCCVYKLFGLKARKCLPPLLLIIFVMGAADALLLPSDFSILSLTFGCKSLPRITATQVIIPLFAVAAGALIVWLSHKTRKPAILATILAVCLVATGVVSARYYSRLSCVDYRSTTSEIISQLSAYPPEQIAKTRRKSHRQMKAFIASQIMPPVLRKAFLVSCGSYGEEE